MERTRGLRLFLAVTLLYAAGIVLLFPYLRYYMDNPDSISYVTIAQKYSNGDFSRAVNGYWSPLICWMLGFLFTFLNDEITTFKIFQLLIGWFALFNFTRLVRAMIVTRWWRWITALAAVPFILSFAFLNLTPDLLFLSVLLFYLNMVSEREFFNHRNYGLIAGVLGLILYFSKAFGFYFFIVHFTLVFLLNYTQTKEIPFRKHLRNNYFQALLIFICISSIWIFLISIKYHHFTLSENATFNLSKEVAAAPGELNRLPVLSGGLFKPVNATAVNAWEDPGLAASSTELHPVASWRDFKVYQLVIKRNLLAIYYFDFRRQMGIVFAFLVLIYFLLGKRKKLFSTDYSFSLFITMFLIYAGYSMILVHSRYLWICTFSMILLIAFMLENLPARNIILFRGIQLIFPLILLFAVKRPVKELLLSEDRDLTAREFFDMVAEPLETVRATYLPDLNLFEASREIADKIQDGEAVASIIKEGAIRDGYSRSSLFSMEARAKYYGQVADDTPDLPGLLNKFRINYVLAYSEDETSIRLPGWHVMYSNAEVPVIIYKRDKSRSARLVN